MHVQMYGQSVITIPVNHDRLFLPLTSSDDSIWPLFLGKVNLAINGSTVDAVVITSDQLPFIMAVLKNLKAQKFSGRSYLVGT